jgi:AraC-like DNA-binding protein
MVVDAALVLTFATMTSPTPLASSKDQAIFRSSQLFGGFELMSARFVHHRFAPHTHDALMIGIIRSGVKSFRLGRDRKFAACGQLSVVNPGEMHTGEREHGPELAYFGLYLPLATLLAIIPEHGGREREIAHPVITDDFIWRHLARAHDALLNSDDTFAAEEGLVLGITSLFKRYAARSPRIPVGGHPAAIRQALAYLEAEAANAATLESLAHASGVGSFHLIRLFNRHLGTTPHAYLTQLRIERAKHLLKAGEPVAQVALNVGFADQAHLTKRFKALTGTTPGRYAAAHK